MRLNRILSGWLMVVGLGAQTVEVVKVTARSLERQLRLPGELAPYQRADLCPRVAGFVERVEVDRGSAVRKGQLLVKLAAPELAAQAGEAQAKAMAVESQRAEAGYRLVAAESTYERLKAASATPGAVAGNDLVLAEKAVESARAVVQTLESSARAARAAAAALRDLEAYLNVTAPFDGVITRRRVHPGALAGPAAGPLLELEDIARLRLVLAVPEAQVAAIRVGTRVAFTVPAHPGRTFHGVVARPAHWVDSRTRTMPVEVDVDNTSGPLVPGMYAEAVMPMRRAGASLMVPPTSVVTTTERVFVIRVREGRAEWVDVARGAPLGDLVEVFGKLDAGNEIVRRGSDEIREGTVLRVAGGAGAAARQ